MFKEMRKKVFRSIRIISESTFGDKEVKRVCWALAVRFSFLPAGAGSQVPLAAASPPELTRQGWS